MDYARAKDEVNKIIKYQGPCNRKISLFNVLCRDQPTINRSDPQLVFGIEGGGILQGCVIPRRTQRYGRHMSV